MFVPNGRPRRGRKRKVAAQSRADRKRMYNHNKNHVNTRGNAVFRKIFDANFVCLCRNQCTRRVPLQVRKRLFNQFWSIGGYPGRSMYLVNCVSEATRMLPSKHTFTMFGYSVCKIALIRTLQINQERIATALKKYKEKQTLADGRGLTTGGRNKIPEAKKVEVRRHISSFPKYVSHYTRNQTDSKFLCSNLNLAKMYKLYKEKVQNPVSESLYKKIFYADFNLRFKTPKKDTCKKCDIFITQIKNADEPTRLLLDECHNAHLEHAEDLELQMNNDLALAKTDPEVEAITYDMMKILLMPRLTTSIVYYKRQLNFYNFGIHIGSSGRGRFNTWQENEASRGTQEVGSCLRKYIQNIAAPVKRLILWSDSCGGQNRSIKLVLMLFHVLQHHPSLETISLRYRLSGHSFLPNDSEFGDVECALKGHDKVCTDKAYMKIMEDCRNENKFEVIRMKSEDFFSVEELEQLITNRKVDINKNKINWFHTHEILIDKHLPNLIKMRKKIGGDFQTVNIAKAKTQLDLIGVELEHLWPNGRPLSKDKVNDLKEMLELVDDEDKPFYDFLQNVSTNDFDDDVEGYGETIDFELE